MTSTCRSHGSASFAVPPTQNTAPVLEFNCLYTHDLRRKQKRWQDGFLRYHTFNRRIMVYDVPRNFIGDCHWSSVARFEEGVELTLEKGGAVVQVAESVGQTETDLTELLKSARKPKSKPGVSLRGMNVNNPAQSRLGDRKTAAPIVHSKHRSLNTLLGQNRPRLGKATLPYESPYDIRHSETDHNEPSHENRPSKLRKVETTAHKESPFTPQKNQERWTANKKTTVTLVCGDRAKSDQEKGSNLPSSQDIDCLLLAVSSDVEATASSPTQQKVPRSTRDDHGTAIKDLRNSHQKDDAQNCGILRVEAALKKQARSDNRHEQNEPISRQGATLKISAGITKRKVLMCRGQVAAEQNDNQDAIVPSSTHADLQQLRLKARLDRIKRRANNTVDSKNAGSDKSSKDPCIGPVPAPDQDVSNTPRRRDDSTHCATSLDAAVTPTIAHPFRREPFDTIQQNPIQNSTAETRSAVPRIQVTPNLQEGLPFVSELQPTMEASEQQEVVGLGSNPTAQYNKKQVADNLSIAPASAAPTGSALLGRLQNKKYRSPHKPNLKLDVSASGTSTVLLQKPFHAPTGRKAEVATTSIVEPDPWSREAFDLFTWRPPDWNEEEWRIMT